MRRLRLVRIEVLARIGVDQKVKTLLACCDHTIHSSIFFWCKGVAVPRLAAGAGFLQRKHSAGLRLGRQRAERFERLGEVCCGLILAPNDLLAYSTNFLIFRLACKPRQRGGQPFTNLAARKEVPELSVEDLSLLVDGHVLRRIEEGFFASTGRLACARSRIKVRSRLRQLFFLGRRCCRANLVDGLLHSLGRSLASDAIHLDGRARSRLGRNGLSKCRRRRNRRSLRGRLGRGCPRCGRDCRRGIRSLPRSDCSRPLFLYFRYARQRSASVTVGFCYQQVAFCRS